MGKAIDLRRTVFDLCEANPAVADIMCELGFTDIVKPGMLQTAGRLMTIPLGAKMKHIAMDTVRQAFATHGYEIEEG